MEALRKGEVTRLTEPFKDVRRLAVERMVEHAVSFGRHAVVDPRLDSTEMGEQQGWSRLSHTDRPSSATSSRVGPERAMILVHRGMSAAAVALVGSRQY